LAIERAQEALPEEIFVKYFEAATEGKPHRPSAEEETLRELEKSVDGKRNAALLRWSIALVFFSIGLQGIATCLSPD
jgi:hypothetical protein